MSVITNKKGAVSTKVVQVGNSIGVVIPKEVSKELNIKKGGVLYLHIDKKSNAIFLTKEKKAAIDMDFINRVEAFTNKYNAALKKLAE